MPGKIFINYRRDDANAVAGRLHDRLAQTFGRNSLFMDVDHIPVGVDFTKHLNEQVASCDVFLAVIGPRWLEAKDENGQRRLDNPDDFVAIEIVAALAREIRVVPVLIDGARMPKSEELPGPLKPLVLRNAIEVRNAQFGRDAELLVAKLKDALGTSRSKRKKFPVYALLAGAALAVVWIGISQSGVKIEQPWNGEKMRLEAEAKRQVAEEERQRQAMINAEVARRVAEAAATKKAEDDVRAKSLLEAQARAIEEKKRQAADEERKRLAAIQPQVQAPVGSVVSVPANVFYSRQTPGQTILSNTDLVGATVRGPNDVDVLGTVTNVILENSSLVGVIFASVHDAKSIALRTGSPNVSIDAVSRGVRLNIANHQSVLSVLPPYQQSVQASAPSQNTPVVPSGAAQCKGVAEEQCRSGPECMWIPSVGSRLGYCKTKARPAQ